MRNILLSYVALITIFSSCSPPSLDNVKIESNYTLNYDYYALVIGGSYYDAYWPELTIVNSSNSSATISFKYSFYVCGVRQTSSSLNRTVNYFAPKGTSVWEMPDNNAMVIRSDARCSGNLILASDVDFDWTVLSVS
jgi:hypothetical protein